LGGELTGGGIAAGVFFLIACLLWQRRAQRGFAARRAAIFDDCRALFEQSGQIDPGSDYPLLQGKYGNAKVLLQPLLDHVGYRKVPSLWLVLTVDSPIALGGSLDVLFRPANIEFFSQIEQLAQRIHLGDEWPSHHMARVSPVGWQAPLSAIHTALGDAIASPDLKEIVVTPRGVRLVVRVCGVERGHYLVLRAMLTEVERIPSEWLAYWLDTLLTVAAAVRADVGETA
jgi:hypothetical protein